MPKFTLSIKAELENFEKIEAVGQEVEWILKFKCSNCGEETPSFISVIESEEYEMSGSRGTANLVLKCKLCERENSCSVLGPSLPYEESSNGEFAPVMTFECRGIEPIEWQPATGFVGTVRESGARVELELDDDFADFDETLGESIGVYGIEGTFEKV